MHIVDLKYVPSSHKLPVRLNTIIPTAEYRPGLNLRRQGTHPGVRPLFPCTRLDKYGKLVQALSEDVGEPTACGIHLLRLSVATPDDAAPGRNLYSLATSSQLGGRVSRGRFFRQRYWNRSRETLGLRLLIQYIFATVFLYENVLLSTTYGRGKLRWPAHARDRPANWRNLSNP